MEDFEAPYAGIPTFLKLPHVNIKDFESLRNVDIAILGAPLDETTTHRSGAKIGPRAIREASTSFSGYSLRSKFDLNDLTIIDAGDVPVIPGNVEKSHMAIYETVKQLVKKNITSTLIGGDHSITYPAIKAHEILKEKIGVIWVDSHLDFDMEYPPGQRYSHSCSLRRTSELPFIDPTNIVVIGYSGYASHPEHEEEVDEAGIGMFSIYDIREEGLEKVAKKSVEIATKNTKSFYLSVDIDVLDPAFAPGSGLHEPGGF
ncbi:MAG: agmatinase family protein, partial [Candidatus Lokiarchaeota archaeon]|nr:agmatinase family protein [Candidatus Lokiarchaeota archaeon]